MYGESGSMKCCDYWIAKLSYLYEIWEHFGSPADRKFLPDELHGFAEPRDFTEFAQSAVGQVLKRVQELRAIAPALAS